MVKKKNLYTYSSKDLNIKLLIKTPICVLFYELNIDDKAAHLELLKY